MAVITLYIQPLLVLLVGLSHLAQGQPLLHPRDLQLVTKPNQSLGLLHFNHMIIKALTSQRSKPKARQLGPFRGKGYLQVRDFPLPYITRGLVVGLIPAGWLDSYGEWTVEENDRAVFEAKGTTIPGIVVIDSPHGSCFIRTKDNLLDCKAEAGTTLYDTNWGKAIRVSRKHVVQEFSAGYKPQAPTSVPLTAVHNDKPAGHRVFVEWVPMKGDGTQPLNF